MKRRCAFKPTEKESGRKINVPIAWTLSALTNLFFFNSSTSFGKNAAGFMGGTCCNFATQLKFVFGYNDTVDIFASHAIGGIVGNLLFLCRPEFRWSTRKTIEVGIRVGR